MPLICLLFTRNLTRALALKMAIDKPRATPDKRSELRAELETLEQQLKANNAGQQDFNPYLAGGRVI